MIADFLISKHSWIIKNVIDEDAVAGICGWTFLVIIVLRENLTTFVNYTLMEVVQIFSLPLIFIITRRQFVNCVGINQRFILKQCCRFWCAAIKNELLKFLLLKFGLISIKFGISFMMQLHAKSFFVFLIFIVFAHKKLWWQS